MVLLQHAKSCAVPVTSRGNPIIHSDIMLRPQMRQYVAEAPDDMIGDRTGQEAQMQVTLRDVEPFSLWVSLCVRPRRRC